jgi:hypothetical protein
MKRAIKKVQNIMLEADFIKYIQSGTVEVHRAHNPRVTKSLLPKFWSIQPDSTLQHYE